MSRLLFVLPIIGLLVACKTSATATKRISSQKFEQIARQLPSSKMEPYTVLRMPHIVGGLRAINRKLTYPRRAAENNVAGKVVLRFIVTKTGEISYINVQKGIGHGCDRAAIKALKSVEIIPGSKNGVPVDMAYSVPVFFKSR